MAARKIEEDSISLIDTFREFKETKNIDRTTLVSVLESTSNLGIKDIRIRARYTL